MTVNCDQISALTLTQQDIYFDQLNHNLFPLYNVAGYIKVSDIDSSKLAKAHEKLVNNSDVFGLRIVNRSEGVRQYISKDRTTYLPVIDFSQENEADEKAQQWLKELVNTPIEVENSELFRVYLLKVSDNQFYYATVVHHIAMDGMGIANWAEKLGRYYQGLDCDIEEVSWLDVVESDQKYLVSEKYLTDKKYWENELRGLPDPIFSMNRADLHSHVSTTASKRKTIKVDENMHQALMNKAAQFGISISQMYLALTAIYFSKANDVNDLVVGLPVHNRRNNKEKEKVGVFASVSPLRLSIDESLLMVDFLQQVKSKTRKNFRVQRYPIGHMQYDASGCESKKALYQIGFNYLNMKHSFTIDEQLVNLVYLSNDYEQTPIQVTIWEQESVEIKLDYNLAYFSEQDANSIATRFEWLIKQIIKAPVDHIRDLQIIPEKEQHQLLVEWNDTVTDYPKDNCIHELFEAQVKANPDATALVFEDKRLSYSELNSRANQLAHYLLTKKQVKPDTMVGICIERSLEMVIAILGILKAGGAYVPLDPDYPQARLAYMLEDAKLDTVITQSHLLNTTPISATQAVCLDDAEIKQQLSQQPVNNLDKQALGLNSTHLAYVIYTSGSTGNPKGVMVTQGNVVNFLSSMQNKPGINSNDSLLAVTSTSFDIHGLELFLPLIVGAKIIVASKSATADSHALIALINDYSVSLMQATPATWKMLVDSQWQPTSAIKVLCGGEALSQSLASKLTALDSIELWNMYGPTETTIWSCVKQVSATDGQVSMGLPIANTQVYLLNKQLQVVPEGVAAELFIGGEGVTLGYLNRPDLTAQAFIDNPFYDETNPNSSERLYKTGDLVRWLPDGNLEYLGRIDHQVKIRGFRIELGEIENSLARYDSVKDAVVVAKTSETGDKRLVAYIVADDRVTTERQVYIEQLRQHVSQSLPDYMVPAVFVLLEQLPLTPNGKVDRKALPEPDMAMQQEEYVAPRTETEKRLCEIWQEVLGIEQVGVTDNFFQLGGHSLLAVKLASAIENALTQSMPLRTILAAPTVAKQAEYLQQNNARVHHFDTITLAKEDRFQPFPLTDIQQAYWLGRRGDFELGNVSTHIYVEIPFQDASADKIQGTLNRLIERHGMLRMVVTADGQQQILESVPEYQLPCYNLTQLEETQAESKVLALRDELSHQVLATDRWPLFDFRLSQLSGQRALLHVSMDILLVDASSMMIMSEEFSTLYQSSEPDKQLAPLSLSFRDYVHAEHALQATDFYQQAEAYWLDRVADFPGRPALPLALEPSQIDVPHFERRHHFVKPQQWQRLKQIAQTHQITPTVLLLGCVGDILNAWSEQAHFALNLTLFNRLPLHPEVNSILGDFTSLSLLEMDYGDTHLDFVARLKAIQEQLWKDLENRAFGGMAMQRALTRQHGHPVNFPVVFTSTLGLNSEQAQSMLASSQDEGGLMEGFSLSQTSQVWLDIQVSDDNGGLSFNWDNVEGLFPAGMLDDMFASWVALLGKLAEHDIHWQQCAPMTLPDSQRQLISKVNSVDMPYQPDLLHSLVEQQIEVQGNKIAVRTADFQLSYRSLGQRSQHLAAQLLADGARPNQLIGVVMHKGWQQVVAVTAILQAGAAYLPIDASQPIERIQRLLMLGQVDQVVTTPDCRAILPDTVQVYDVIQALPNVPEFALPQRAVPSDIAYVIFTSGSTGEPKGVTISHEAALNTIQAINLEYQVTEHDLVFGLSNLNFDLSVWDIFGVLGAGGTLVLPKAEECRTPSAWLPYLQLDTEQPNAEQTGVTLWNTVPALMDLLVTECEYQAISLPLRLVMMSGDWIPTDLPARISAVAPKATQMSLGGATEASIWSIHYPIKDADPSWPSIPYGKALPNQQFFVLQPDLSLAPLWVTGDLYIGGIGLALGYWQDEEKTQASFITHPVTGERLYKTGDRGRLFPDGNIEFKGRVDNQVKINGYRIELGEIEARLKSHAWVNDAVVVTHSFGKAPQLVAYVTREAAGKDMEVSHSSFEERLAFKVAQKSVRVLTGEPIVLPEITDNRLEVAVQTLPQRAYDVQSKLSAADLGQLLHAFYRQNFAELPLPKAFYPSGGTLFPIQTYVQIAEGMGAEGTALAHGGCFYYQPMTHELIRISDAPPSDGNDAPLSMYLVADMEAVEPLYGDLSYDLCQSEAGYMAQLLETSLSPIALSRIDDGPCKGKFDAALGLSASHVLLQSYVGGISAGEMSTESVQAHDTVTLTCTNRKSYRQYKGSPYRNEELMLCLSVLRERHVIAQLHCRFYVYLRQTSLDESGSSSENEVLAKGLYHYDLTLHRLVLVKEGADVALCSGENLQIEAAGSFMILMVKQPEQSRQAALFESGLAGQALSTAGLRVNIGFCAIGQVDDDATRREIGLSGNEVVVHALIGGKISAAQMKELVFEKASIKLEELLKAHVQETLPEYMAPNIYIPLQEIPLTANGKVDRKGLPEPEINEQQQYIAPRTVTERTLCGIWKEIFGLEKVGVSDNYFQIGGDSIMSIKIISHYSKAGFNISMRDIFSLPTILKLAEKIEKDKLISIDRKGSSVTSVKGKDNIFSIDAAVIQNGQYTSPGNRHWYFERTVDLEKWGPCWLFEFSDCTNYADVVKETAKNILNLHESLRVRLSDPQTYLLEEISDIGELNYFECVHFNDETEFQNHLELFKGSLSLYGSLIKFFYCNFGSDKKDRLYIVAHHLLLDQYSTTILAQDFLQLFHTNVDGTGQKLVREGASFSEWVAETRNWLYTDQARENIAFWSKMSSKKIKPIPTDFEFKHSKNTIGKNDNYKEELSLELTKKIQSKAKKHGLSDAHFYFSAMIKALYQWSGNDQICFEMVSTGRSENSRLDLSETVGWLNDYIPIFVNVDQEKETLSFVHSVRDSLEECTRHSTGFSELKFKPKEVLPDYDISEMPVPEISVNYIPMALSDTGEGDMTSRLVPLGEDVMTGHAREAIHKLSFDVYFSNGRCVLSWDYGRDVYKPSTILRLAEVCHKELVSLINDELVLASH